MNRLIIGLFSVLLAAGIAPAAVTLPKVFSHHMVLQRERPVPVWGWAAPDEMVKVQFADQEKSTTANAAGEWRVVLEPMAASSVPRELRVVSDNKSTISSLIYQDVLVGEVWLCSGQSNMGFLLQNAANSQADMAQANLPTLRMFAPFNGLANTPQKEVRSKPWWTVATPQAVSNCSAVGFYFGRRIQAELGVPVGLIGAAWGGTRIEPWTPMSALDQTPELAGMMAAFHQEQQALPQVPAGGVEAVVTNRAQPAAIYNYKVHPLIPYAIRGVIWYQGEHNAGDPGDLYFHKMRALIGGWRQAWGQGDFPFYFVQLANFGRDKKNLADEEWANLRDCQRKALAIPKTGMASAIDVGEAGDIHPKRKSEVGERLALWALARDYGKTNLVVSGPLYRDMKIEGNRIRLSFEHVGGGLMVGEKIGSDPVHEAKQGKLQRFAIAGEDRKWVWADAVIEGDSVLVSSPAVIRPVAVRYAYSNNPEGCNLYNRADLPASPFRTDIW
jgi:sialate O-acetylesterase